MNEASGTLLSNGSVTKASWAIFTHSAGKSQAKLVVLKASVIISTFVSRFEMISVTSS
ncbi:hypothetical protein HanPSC8_Chr16g0705921 [Helianthus annuus]|nr:hypothetical protein HanPSC8_Chr16g0705921 [Helianthus annuus]